MSPLTQIPFATGEIITGGAWMAAKIIEAYKQYSETKKTISKHDFCFYYNVYDYLDKRK